MIFTLISYCLVEHFNPPAVKVIALNPLVIFSKEHGAAAIAVVLVKTDVCLL